MSCDCGSFEGKVDILVMQVEYLQSELRACEYKAREEIARANERADEAVSKINQYRIRAQKAEGGSLFVERIIYNAFYTKVDKAVGMILSGDTKRGIVELRHMLPAAYKHTFQKAKA